MELVEPIVILQNFKSPRHYSNKPSNKHLQKIISVIEGKFEVYKYLIDNVEELSKIFDNNDDIFVQRSTQYQLKGAKFADLEKYLENNIDHLPLYYVVDGILIHQDEFKDGVDYKMWVITKSNSNNNLYHSVYMKIYLRNEPCWLGLSSTRMMNLYIDLKTVQIDE